MIEISLKEMLEAGVHFGHKRDKWNPKMQPYIFTEKNGVHIFDLTKTKEHLLEAMNFAGKISSEGGVILFVGTKNQTKGIVRDAAMLSGSPYMVERWPGGMLTNFQTILGRLKFLKDSEEKLGSAEAESLTKKESLFLNRKLEKLNTVFEGVKETRDLPNAIFVSDICKESTAVQEAKKLGIPVIGIADTNASPDIEYLIPGNDDAVRSVKYISEKIAQAIAASKKAAVTPETEKTEETEVKEVK